MPIYEYACQTCGTAFERRRRFEEREAAIDCPSCEAPALPVLSVPGLVGGGGSRAVTAPRPAMGPSCCGGMCGMN